MNKKNLKVILLKNFFKYFFRLVLSLIKILNPKILAIIIEVMFD